jgi:hypothetical protein
MSDLLTGIAYRSIERQYTPPTCTLAIAAKQSALSRWTKQLALQQLRFQLRFDDPRVPQDRQITIRGDRAQLEVLYDAVSTYVQDLLAQSRAIALPHFTAHLAGDAPEEDSPSPSIPNAPAIPTSEGDRAIRLKPQGLVHHDLFLGSLATEESGSVVRLSALQLFDLATALDEYASEVMALPRLDRDRAWKGAPAWAGATAAVLALAVGVTATLSQLQKPSDSTTSTQTVSRSQTQIDADASPEPLDVPGPPQFSEEELPPPPTDLPKPLDSELVEPSPSPSPTQPAAESASPSPDPSPVPSPSPTDLATVEEAPTASPTPAAPPEIAIAPDPLQDAPPPSPPNQPSQEQNLERRRLRSRAAVPAPQTRSGLSGDRGNGSVPETYTTEEMAPPGTASLDEPGDSPGTAFDTIPQVAEVRSYFQQEWQPPEGLTQTLEYTLVLNSDGSIQRVIPLGQAAGNYLDRTGMPLREEAFVSPVEGNKTPRIRVVLNANGQVQTFLESAE